MKKFFAIMLVFCLAFAAFANGAREAAPAAEDDWGPKPEGTKEVLIWTFYGETMKNQYQQVVDAFNASQTDYHVTVEFQGGQAEVAAKLASTDNSELPAAFHGAVENTAQFASAGYAVPMQYFYDRDTEGWAELDSTWAAIRSGYTDKEGNLWAYPQGYSYGALFYNADMLAAAGIDPATIKCTDDLLAACRKLKAEGYCSTPIGFHPDGFYFNEMLGREGIMYYDNDNGYSGDITKCLYVDDAKVNATIAKMLDFYQTLHKEGLAVPYGSNYQKEVLPEMGTKNCCFFIGVVSITNKILQVATDFTVGVQPLISVTAEGSRKGEMPGGTGLFICDNGDKWAQQGAYEFAKFSSQADQAGYFASVTGYLAPNEAAYNSAIYQDFLQKCPTFSSIYDSLANSDDSGNNPYIPIGTEMKAANKLAISTVTSDVTADIQATIKTACSTIQEAIDLYNLSN
jgi:sn-glycerol 3-phosphate transport system substrate-binding protein